MSEFEVHAWSIAAAVVRPTFSAASTKVRIDNMCLTCGRLDQRVTQQQKGVACLGRGFPAGGLPIEELLAESGHRIPRRPRAAVPRHRFGVARNQPPGPAPGFGDGHGIGVADGPVARSLADHAFECSALRSGRPGESGRAPRRRRCRSAGRGVWRRGCAGRRWMVRSQSRPLVRAARLGGSAGSARSGFSSRKPHGPLEPLALYSANATGISAESSDRGRWQEGHHRCGIDGIDDELANAVTCARCSSLRTKGGSWQPRSMGGHSWQGTGRPSCHT